MILLAAHLNVPVENIYSPSKKQADYYPKPKLSSNQERVFRKFFNIDLLIYDIANIIMDEKIQGIVLILSSLIWSSLVYFENT